MVDEQSVELFSSIFGSRTFAYQRLGQVWNSSLSAFTSVVREYLDPLDPVLKADWCAQYVDETGVAPHTATEMIQNIDRVFKKMQKAGLKFSSEKCQPGKKPIDF